MRCGSSRIITPPHHPLLGAGCGAVAVSGSALGIGNVVERSGQRRTITTESGLERWHFELAAGTRVKRGRVAPVRIDAIPASLRQMAFVCLGAGA